MRRMARTAWLVIGLGVAVLAGGRQASAAELAGLKIAFLDVAKTFDSYTHTIESDKTLSAKGEQKKDQRERMVDEIKKLREGADLLSDKAKDERQKQLEDKVRKLEDFERTAGTELQRERDTMAKAILEEIDVALREYAKAQDYDLILNERVAVYSKQTLDITDTFIPWLNQRYKPSKP